MTEPRHDDRPEVRPETTAILAGRAAADRSLAPVLYPTSNFEFDTVEPVSYTQLRADEA